MTKRSGILLLPANLIAVWLMVASACQVLAVDPVVSNVQAKQREGSRLVDITYDVADPDSPTLTVYLKVSPDGGKTWKGPVVMVNGDVGLHIVPGTAKKLIWDAGKEMPNQFGVKYRYKVGASDQWLVPDGMTLIPAGMFQMGDSRVSVPGSPLPIGDRLARIVSISDFSIDKYEVSIERWKEVRNWAINHGYDLWQGKSFGENHPVQSLNWYDAVKWNNARSEMEGKVPAYYEDAAMIRVYRTGEIEPAGVKWDGGYRLPTAAEWEKAARGGTAGKLYPWGTNEISPALANYGVNNGGTKPVGSYEANGYGLYDIAGNVFEWCWDWHGSNAGETDDNPRGPLTGKSRACRGGCWLSGEGDCRLALRTYYDYAPSARVNESYGFRSVLPVGRP